MAHDLRAKDGQVNIYYGYLAKAFCDSIYHMKNMGERIWGESEWVILSQVFFDAMKKRLPICTVRQILILSLPSVNISDEKLTDVLEQIFKRAENEYSDALRLAGITQEKSTWHSFLAVQKTLKQHLFPIKIRFPQSLEVSRLKSDLIRTLSQPFETSHMLSHVSEKWIQSLTTISLQNPKSTVNGC